MEFPRMVMVERRMAAPRVDDVPAAVEQGLAALDLGQKVRPGQSVAVTAGSRGVTDMVAALKAVVSHLRGLGAEPYIAPAMGSHGGATAQGQTKLLAGLGVTEDAVGAPVRASMDCDSIATTSFGQPVLIGRDFTQADHIVVVNRVKPHTSFRGKIESGLAKMLAIGMAKGDGAISSHLQFYRHGFEPVVLEIADLALARLPLLCGVGLVENHREETALVRVCSPDKFIDTDAELLQEARALMGRVPFEDIHLLIVDEMGKNISGSGMDSNVTGRVMNQASPEAESRQFLRIFVRDLTPSSQGNALGVGTADFAAQRLVEKIDLVKTRVNCLTAAVPEKGRVPIAFDRDDEAVAAGLATCGVPSLEAARVVWIKNTLELERMYISSALVPEARAMSDLALAGEPGEMPFMEDGSLPFGLFDPAEG